MTNITPEQAMTTNLDEVDELLAANEAGIKSGVVLVPVDLLKQLRDEVERLREYEWMYNDLCK